MCGIAGIVHCKNGKELLPQMLNSIAHRGQDDQGEWHDENVALGHRRLSIVDISNAGHQPMVSADENFVLSFNGEIYNHPDLRKLLLQKGYIFTSASDTETLLYWLIDRGTDGLASIEGIFAFAFYNRNADELILARDASGAKPLYFSSSKTEFIFASEIKAFLNWLNLDKTINHAALHQYCHLLWSDETPFLSVKKLEPGCFLSLKTNTLQPRIEAFSRLHFEDNHHKILNLHDVQQELEERLENIFEQQLLGDVPAGFLLSGGVDSSLIVSLLGKKKALSPDSIAFTIDPGKAFKKEGFGDDIYFAKTVAKKFHLQHKIIEATPEFLADLDPTVWFLDEPIADPASMMVAQISRLARDFGLKYLLTGTGADEIFTGYRRHHILKYRALIQNINQFLPPQIWSKFLPESNFKRRAHKLFSANSKRPTDFIASLFSWLPESETLNLFKPELQDNLKHRQKKWSENIWENTTGADTELRQLLALEQNGFLPHHNLTYLDKSAMRYGIEMRVPYLQQSLVKWLNGLPDSIKIKGQTTKYLLKSVARNHLPKALIQRKKTGFGAPIRHYFTSDKKFQQNMEDRLNSGILVSKGGFNEAAIQKLFQNTKTGKADGAYPLLALATIESWLRQFAK